MDGEFQYRSSVVTGREHLCNISILHHVFDGQVSLGCSRKHCRHQLERYGLLFCLLYVKVVSNVSTSGHVRGLIWVRRIYQLYSFIRT
jgi:hypothetical protein